MPHIIDNPPDPELVTSSFIGLVRLLKVGQAVEAENMDIKKARVVVSRVKAGEGDKETIGREFSAYPHDGKIYIKRVA